MVPTGQQRISIAADSVSREEKIRSQLVKQIVLTRHNNKTYRIDDVDFTKTPMSTFTRTSEKKEENLTFLAYYEKFHQLKITDRNQPLLVVKQRKHSNNKDKKEEEEIIYLVPELCTMTGITDNMRR